MPARFFPIDNTPKANDKQFVSWINASITVLNSVFAHH